MNDSGLKNRMLKKKFSIGLFLIPCRNERTKEILNVFCSILNVELRIYIRNAIVYAYKVAMQGLCYEV